MHTKVLFTECFLKLITTLVRYPAKHKLMTWNCVHSHLSVTISGSDLLCFHCGGFRFSVDSG